MMPQYQRVPDLFSIQAAARHPRIGERPIEQIGEKLRAMMPWIGKNGLVDRSRN
jgi:hypothetical protein